MIGLRFAYPYDMPRKPLIRTDEFPYHIVGRTNNRDWFYVDMDECWKIFSKYLQIISDRYHTKIISFVLMSNHFHLILQTPLSNLDEIMNYLLREVSKKIGFYSGRINHVFGGRYKWCLIDRNSYFHHAYKYVYRNPVEKKIVKMVEDYKFSTIKNLVKPGSIDFPCYDLEIFPCDLIPQKVENRLQWLNQSYLPKQNELIRNALRRSTFEFTKSVNFAKLVKSLTDYQKVGGTF